MNLNAKLEEGNMKGGGERTSTTKEKKTQEEVSLEHRVHPG